MDLLALWGKTGEGGRYHPLLFHAIDAGCVTRTLLGAAPYGHLCQRFAALVHVEVDAVPDLLSFLVALHDIGKAAPGFQRKAPALWARVQAAGYHDVPSLIQQAFRHDVESYMALRALSLWPREGADVLAQAVGAHHGAFITPVDSEGYPQVSDRALNAASWVQARTAMIARLHELFWPHDTMGDCGQLATACMLLNGLTILADWIASDETAFPVTAPMSPDDYFPLAADRAGAALERIGLLHCPIAETAPTFATLFPQIQHPRPLQQVLDTLDLASLHAPVLTIIEAAMGEGKTEAALLLARRIAAAQGGGGFYFALPTLATSNQLFSRVLQFLSQVATPEMPAEVMLAHSQAELHEGLEHLLHPAGGTLGGDGSLEHVQAETWFLPAKRRLLSPFAVGTVDQCMLGALRVRHGALRLFGLAGKVVIIDEVHAYDAYMTTIIERLLAWLSALGASVILLSATLPSTLRARLIDSFGGDTMEDDATAYPLITLAQADEPARLLAPPGSGIQKSVCLSHHRDDERESIWHDLVAQVREGGCAVWICNTVQSAQQTYLGLQSLLNDQADTAIELILYHARMLRQDRQAVERAVLRKFGPDDAERPARAIVVATQVVEQSLDLDFDLMISELAPVDLLLQRMGRLWRHNRMRPTTCATATFTVIWPSITAEGCPVFEGSGRIYSPFILLKTMIALAGKVTLAIPEELRALVERVYDDAIPSAEDMAPLGVMPAFAGEAHRRMEEQHRQVIDAARPFLLGKPDPRGKFVRQREMPTLDDELLGAALGGQTRLSEPSVRVILLPLDHPAHRLTDRLDNALARELLAHSVSIAHWALVEHCAALDPLPCIDRTPALRGHILLPTSDEGYSWQSGRQKFRLIVSPELGVIIESRS